MRALLSVAVALGLLTAGCLSESPGAAAPDALIAPAEAEEPVTVAVPPRRSVDIRDAPRTEVPFHFEGSVERLEERRHPIEVPADTVAVRASIDADALPGARTRVYLFGPNGTSAGGTDTNRTIGRAMLERAGFGTYHLVVRNEVEFGIPAPLGATYRIDGAVVRGDPTPATLFIEPPTPPERAEVVVAVIDTGINVYHDAFATTDTVAPHAFDSRTGQGPRVVPVERSADYAASVARDDPLWRAMETGVLYRFPGTRVLGISFRDPHAQFAEGVVPVLDDDGHGTATAASVLVHEPRAVIVMVHISSTSSLEIAAGLRWVAEQPWIDVVSVSMGYIANLPLQHTAFEGTNAVYAVADATRAVALAGKVHVNAAGNDPSYALLDPFNSPPWVIAVGGSEPTTRGRSALASNGADYVAAFTVEVPTHDSFDGTFWNGGTSFSAPAVAGSFARAILAVRETVGHVGTSVDGLLVDAGGTELRAGQLRDAFNETAIYWKTAEYSPTTPPDKAPRVLVLSASLPVAPVAWPQMGWGHVDASVGDAAAAWLLGGRPAIKDEATRQGMATEYALRAYAWMFLAVDT